MKAPGYALGVLLAALGALCWSLGGGMVRATDGIDGWQIIFFRSLTVFVCIAIWLGAQYGRDLPRFAWQAGANGVIAGIAVGTAGLSFILSLFYTTVAQSIFMTGFAPFLSAIMGWLFLRERIAGITWVAMSIALGGLAVMIAGGWGSGSFFGIVLSLYSVFCFSCYAVLLRYGRNTAMNIALIWNALYLTIVSAIVIIVPSGLRTHGGLADFAIGWWNMLPIFTMGAVQITLGLALFTLGSKSVPAAQLSLIALVEPTFSPLWAWLIAGELPPVWTFIGGGIILGAIALQAAFVMRKVESRPARP